MRQMRHSARAFSVQSVGRARRVERFRRRAWSPRPAEIKLAPKYSPDRVTLAGEFPDEAPRSSILGNLRRVIGLASDITLLLLLSPFFVVWFLYRVASKLIRPRT